MKKKLNKYFFVLFSLFLFFSIFYDSMTVNAKSFNYSNKIVDYRVSYARSSSTSADKHKNHGTVIGGGSKNCSGSNSYLGSYDDPDSVAWLLKRLFNWIKILGPFIVLLMSAIEFTKVLFTGDDDGMKKAQKNLVTRLILAACLFLLPDAISYLLEFFGITSSGICGLG